MVYWSGFTKLSFKIVDQNAAAINHDFDIDWLDCVRKIPISFRHRQPEHKADVALSSLVTVCSFERWKMLLLPAGGKLHLSTVATATKQTPVWIARRHRQFIFCDVVSQRPSMMHWERFSVRRIVTFPVDNDSVEWATNSCNGIHSFIRSFVCCWSLDSQDKWRTPIWQPTRHPVTAADAIDVVF